MHYLSHDDIEAKAEEVLSKICPDVLKSPKAVPIHDVVAFFKKVLFDFEQVLPTTSRGTKIRGLFYKDNKSNKYAILIDRSLKGTRTFPFVFAHELGHLILHRKMQIVRSHKSLVTSDMSDNGQKPKTSWTDQQRVEWQAKKFASAFLLPRLTIAQALISTQKEFGITHNFDRLCRSTNFSPKYFKNVIQRLQGIYGVGPKVVEYRLDHLKFLSDS